MGKSRVAVHSVFKPGNCQGDVLKLDNGVFGFVRLYGSAMVLRNKLQKP